MNEDNIIDANEGLNEFDDDSYGPFLLVSLGCSYTDTPLKQLKLQVTANCVLDCLV